MGEMVNGKLRHRRRERTGHVIKDFADYISRGYLIAVLPISRVHIEYSPIEYVHGVVFHPAGFLELEELNVVPNRTETKSHAELASALSRIDIELLNAHPLIAFPCRFRWDEFRRGSHEEHLEFIRTLSAYVDRTCLNVIKFNFCTFGVPDTIPGRAGTVIPNPMMAGALLYSHEAREGRIVGGSAFTHALVKGLGLSLQSLPRRSFPRVGEVGRIVSHGLDLFASALEAGTTTLQFVQAMSLLEFLSDPHEFQKFQEVSKIIARYKASNQQQYLRMLARFNELTGKRGEDNEILGYRTRIMHMGQRLEEILPDPGERGRVLHELQGYAGCVIEHMIEHSEMEWTDYVKLRQTMKAYLGNGGEGQVK